LCESKKNENKKDAATMNNLRLSSKKRVQVLIFSFHFHDVVQMAIVPCQLMVVVVVVVGFAPQVVPLMVVYLELEEVPKLVKVHVGVCSAIVLLLCQHEL
jgi:hypothetical protein